MKNAWFDYYKFLNISEIYPVHSKNCEGKGLDFLTRGKISYKWEKYSNFTCKLRFFWHFESEALAQYLLLALAVERVAALYRPLAVRLWATHRNARLLIAGLVLLSVLDATPSLFEVALKHSANGVPSAVACLGIYKHVIQMVTLIVFNILLNNILPSVAVLVCSLIMSYKIKNAMEKRRQLQHQLRSKRGFRRPFEQPNRVVTQNNLANGPLVSQASKSARAGSSQRLQEMKLAKSVLVIATLETLMYLMHGLIWSAFALQIFLQAPPAVRGTLHALGYVISDLMIVMRLWNLYVYYFTIPAFRVALQRLLCSCCCARFQPEFASSGERASSYFSSQLSRSQVAAQRSRSATINIVSLHAEAKLSREKRTLSANSLRL